MKGAMQSMRVKSITSMKQYVYGDQRLTGVAPAARREDHSAFLEMVFGDLTGVEAALPHAEPLPNHPRRNCTPISGGRHGCTAILGACSGLSP